MSKEQPSQPVPATKPHTSASPSGKRLTEFKTNPAADAEWNVCPLNPSTSGTLLGKICADTDQVPAGTLRVIGRVFPGAASDSVDVPNYPNPLYVLANLVGTTAHWSGDKMLPGVDHSLADPYPENTFVWWSSATADTNDWVRRETITFKGKRSQEGCACGQYRFPEGLFPVVDIADAIAVRDEDGNIISVTPQTVTSTYTVTVPTTAILTSVYLKIAHTFVGDLTVKVENPAGVEVTLFAGLQADGNYCSGHDVDATFVPAATGVPDVVARNSPSPAVAGTYKLPDGLTGTDPNGTWSLKVTDGGSEDTGRVEAFLLSFRDA